MVLVIFLRLLPLNSQLYNIQVTFATLSRLIVSIWNQNTQKYSKFSTRQCKQHQNTLKTQSFKLSFWHQKNYCFQLLKASDSLIVYTLIFVFILIQKLLPVLMKAGSFFSEELYRSLVPPSHCNYGCFDDARKRRPNAHLLQCVIFGREAKKTLLNKLFFRQIAPPPLSHLFSQNGICVQEGGRGVFLGISSPSLSKIVKV